MEKQLFYTGLTVICRDNENVETHLKQNEYYTVSDVTNQGALIRVKGVPLTLASTRFTPIKLMPPTTSEELR